MTDPLSTRWADVLCDVAARLQQLCDSGRHSRTIDADEVVKLLLTIADRVDPPVAAEESP